MRLGVGSRHERSGKVPCLNCLSPTPKRALSPDVRKCNSYRELKEKNEFLHPNYQKRKIRLGMVVNDCELLSPMCDYVCDLGYLWRPTRRRILYLSGLRAGNENRTRMCMCPVLKGLQAAGHTSGINHVVQMQATGNNAKLDKPPSAQLRRSG
jgi:hypothetical protein